MINPEPSLPRPSCSTNGALFLRVTRPQKGIPSQSLLHSSSSTCTYLLLGLRYVNCILIFFMHLLKSIAKSLRTFGSASTARWVWLLGIFLAVGLLSRLIRVSLSHGPYDHDIDTFLYMAWRLLEGNLLFIDHYDSKLPIVQYLYVPSFLSGSIFGHRLVAFLVNIVTSVLFYRCLRSLQRLGFLSRKVSHPWMVLCSILLLCFSQTHAGGLSGHLHLFANGFLVLALWLLLQSFSVNPKQPLRLGWSLLGGGALALAIQTRPNLLFSIGCCCLVWLITRWLQGSLGWKESGTICSLVIGAVLISLPFLLPYLLHPDGLKLLKMGGWDLLHQWNSEGHGIRPRLGLLKLLKKMYWDSNFVDFLLYGLPLLLILTLLLRNVQRTPSIHPRNWATTTWIPLLSSSFIVGLWLSFLKTHFFSHYLLLEIVPITLLFAWIPAGLVQSCLPQSLRVSFISIGGVISIFIILNLVVVEPVRLLIPSETSVNAKARAQEMVLQHLRSRSSAQNFFAPGDPLFHWKLQEPMPVKGIHRAWMFDPAVSLSSSVATQHMGIATSPDQRCDQILAQPTDIIIWGKAPLSILQNCLIASNSTWQELTEEWGVTGSGYHIFRRRP